MSGWVLYLKGEHLMDGHWQLVLVIKDKHWEIWEGAWRGLALVMEGNRPVLGSLWLVFP